MVLQACLALSVLSLHKCIRPHACPRACARALRRPRAPATRRQRPRQRGLCPCARSSPARPHHPRPRAPASEHPRPHPRLRPPMPEPAPRTSEPGSRPPSPRARAPPSHRPPPAPCPGSAPAPAQVVGQVLKLRSTSLRITLNGIKVHSVNMGFNIKSTVGFCKLAARVLQACSTSLYLESARCKAVRPGHSIWPKIRVTESGIDLITIFEVFLSFKTVVTS
jgi:hypothetical protein